MLHNAVVSLKEAVRRDAGDKFVFASVFYKYFLYFKDSSIYFEQQMGRGRHTCENPNLDKENWVKPKFWRMIIQEKSSGPAGALRRRLLHRNGNFATPSPRL